MKRNSFFIAICAVFLVLGVVLGKAIFTSTSIPYSLSLISLPRTDAIDSKKIGQLNKLIRDKYVVSLLDEPGLVAGYVTHDDLTLSIHLYFTPGTDTQHYNTIESGIQEAVDGIFPQ